MSIWSKISTSQSVSSRSKRSRISALLLVYLLIVLLVSSCGTVRAFEALFGIDSGIEIPPYPAETDLYPAIFEWIYGTDGLVDTHRNIIQRYGLNIPEPRLVSADVFNNNYQVNNFIAADGATLVLLDIHISLNPENIFLFELAASREYDDGRWYERSTFTFFDWELKKQEIAQFFVSVASDDADRFQEANSDAIANSNFMYIVMKDMTTIGRNNFFDENMKGQRATFVGVIRDIEEVNEVIGDETFKYKISLRNSQNNSLYPDIFGSFTSLNFETTAYADYFTNSEDVIGIQQNTEIPLEGLYTSVSQSSLSDTLFIDIVDDK